MPSLPRTCIPVPRIELDCYDWYERHNQKCRLVQTQGFDLVFLGDSITHFWAGEDGPHYGTDDWDQRFRGRAALNLGFGFDRTQNLLWRIENGELLHQNPRLFVLNIGTNQFSVTPNYPEDSPEDAAAGVQAVILKLRALFPHADILVMAVFPRNFKNDPIRTRIDALNRITASFLRQQKDSRIHFLDLSHLFTEHDGELKRHLFADQTCHPNLDGYRLWGDAIMPFLPVPR